jgi:hypothetical protein
MSEKSLQKIEKFSLASMASANVTENGEVIIRNLIANFVNLNIVPQLNRNMKIIKI